MWYRLTYLVRMTFFTGRLDRLWCFLRKNRWNLKIRNFSALSIARALKCIIFGPLESVSDVISVGKKELG